MTMPAPDCAKSLTSTQTTTSATRVATALAQAVAAGEVWDFEFNLGCQSTAGGVRFDLAAPAGSTIEGYAWGGQAGGGAGSALWVRIAALSTLTSAFSTSLSCVQIRVRIKVGGTAGTVELGLANQTGGSTATLHAGAQMIGTKVSEV